MRESVGLFRELTTKYTDRVWARSRDDLISKSIKALRAFKEGQSLDQVKKNREVSFEIEDILENLQKFVLENPNQVDRLIKALGIYVKSPSPCKIRLISLVEVFLEDITATKD